MTRHPHFAQLQQYPFEKLRLLTEHIEPPDHLPHIPLSLGEPKHTPPDFVVAALADPATLTQCLTTYPATRGTDELRNAIAGWLQRRFAVGVDPGNQILPVTGTREALFSFAQAQLSGSAQSKVLMPNPFYQIYEGAALLAGATPVFVDNNPAEGYQQDLLHIDPAILADTEIVYLCSPGNPTGQIISQSQLQGLIELAHKYDFVIAADECYSEIYFDEQQPPVSLLSASDAMGNADYARCVVFHSLSKRSNLPGLRSGFVAGDPQIMTDYLKYRTYHGCAMSAHHQHASALAWQDEEHVTANRQLYHQKFAAVEAILAPHYAVHQPAGSFFHWLPLPMDDQQFCQQLLAQYNVTVMPGSFLARAGATGNNPGQNHVRIAWVAPQDQCIEAAQRLAEFARTALPS
ncbi:MAG: succinyldiaminopimelate transaminase [Pseudomonadota bacterium]